MHLDLIRKIEQELEIISSQYYKMILVCEHQQGSTVKAVAQKLQLPILNVSLLLSDRLKEYPRKRMAGKVQGALSDILRYTRSQVICLENIEVLFDPALRQDVLRLLQSLSRNYILIVSWKGSYDGKRFVYAVPGHTEYYECSEFDGIVIS